ncbi:MAG TPA: hypothetical protein VG757_03770 [Devosia sp.]|nr:hypothetical protein [Devosia sp.]
MKLNSKLTWGAAWTGLALIVAVPSADFLTGKGSTPAALITSDTDPVQAADPAKSTADMKTASITPAAPTPTLMPDARKITLAPVSTPATATTPTVTTTPKVTIGAPTPTSEAAASEEPEVQTASLGISATNPPFPAPLSQRPKEFVTQPAPVVAGTPTVVASPTAVATVQPQAQVPVVLEPAPDAPLIIDEEALAERVAVTDPDRPVPPAGIADDPSERQTLDEYLARRGLLDDGSSSAVVTYSDAGDDYDPDGFYLSDGPNNDSRHMTRAQWRRWLLARGVDPDELEPF